MPEEYLTADGEFRVLHVNAYGGLHDDNGTFYSYDPLSSVASPLASGAANSICPSCYLAGGWGVGAARLTSGWIGIQLAKHPNLLRFFPQSWAKGIFSRGGWQAGQMKGRTAARGGWSRVTGRGPDYRVQWSAGGGRHGGSYWKVSGSPSGGTSRVPYWFSKNNF